MRFTFTDVMTRSEYLPSLAVAAEAAGYDGFTIPDSIAYPEHSDAVYPYTADGDRSFLEGKEFIEPFVLAASLGAITERIRFNTFVVKFPLRAPVWVAKQAFSVAKLTGNRLGLGIGLGTSPYPDDYLMAGVDPAHKGARMDEAIDVFRGLESGEFFEFHGRFYDVPSLKVCPVPTRPVPLLIGGHSDAALQRAATKGNGWMHAGGPRDALTSMLKKLHGWRVEAGKVNEPFEIHAAGTDARTVQGCKQLEDLGVTDVVVGFRNPYLKGDDTQPLADKLAKLERFAEDVICKVNP
ncbi:MAG: TIGR03619 family F420-dependent LLM class oxidoreductase [Actinomycetota bacterium]|uniref:TIGR03619 family F420-dependent LLM class oxidoreductase n=1 Tax=Mycobacterium lentiflavum TaxID=141349 RepID=A0ABY3UW10_MYCLN|nr:TIGR03619 family F420-dependent LLM class oxidoreductase [Mycobacterium lentiflavum]MEE3062866.1 TIGR03619 family F420-dependent LLM class oxidoreductase [Actinomycetota bacterium]ULP43772.1 TIGR03619 family F420-dependent LLM class oxidoreductase [Mycobacterium lentiflavum]